MIETSFPPLPDNPKNILFVCTGNSCRSAMAEGFLTNLLGKENPEIQVRSAGTEAWSGKKASLQTLECLKKEGIDFEHHRTQKITPRIIEEADLIFVMEYAHRKGILSLFPGAQNKIFFLSHFYTGPDRETLAASIPDPIGMGNIFYENVSEIIKICCGAICDQIKKENPLLSA